jgi:hypothetical protein
VAGELVPVKPFQVIVWLSLDLPFAKELSSKAPRFPAVLDSGHSHNFSIQEQHLRRWAGITPEFLHHLGHIRVSGQRIPLRNASIWIHPNQPRQRDQLARQSPFCLGVTMGMAVHSGGTPTVARLPLLGLRSLVVNNLLLTVDGARNLVSLRTPRRFWFFG